MAFRRPPFRRSFRRSFPRRSRGVRQITEPRRWEMANFHYTGSITPTGLTSEGVILDLISQAHFDNFGTDAQVRGLADAIRTVEVGGIVWTTMLYNLGSGTAAGAFNHIQEVLFTDRIDSSGSPETGIDWWATQAPIDPSGVADADFPVRVHHRAARVLYCPGTIDFSSGIALSTAIANSAVGPGSWPSRSVRIRGGLGDRQGLFLQLTVLNSEESATAFVAFKTVGSLYYRAKM